jgi:hypothetical protein
MAMYVMGGVGRGVTRPSPDGEPPSWPVWRAPECPSIVVPRRGGRVGEVGGLDTGQEVQSACKRTGVLHIPS